MMGKKINLTNATKIERRQFQLNAFEKGWAWLNGTAKIIRNLDAKFVFLDIRFERKTLTCCSEFKTFLESPNIEILPNEI